MGFFRGALGGALFAISASMALVADAGAAEVGRCTLNQIANSYKEGLLRLNANDHARALVAFAPLADAGLGPAQRQIANMYAAGQGVGYLDDGTMVVCEDGGAMIGKDTEIIVKSVLQQSAGRLIFGRLPTPGDR